MTVVSLAFSAVLALAAAMSVILGARMRPAARAYLSLTALLYAALSAADAVAILWAGATTASFSNAVMLLVCALAPVGFALALFARFERPPSQIIASILLVLSLLAGVAAAALGITVLSFAPLAAGAFAMLALAARRWRTARRDAFHAILSAFCIIGGAAAVMTGGAQGRTALALFSAASLLGISLALARRSRLAVEDQRNTGFAAAIRAQR